MWFERRDQGLADAVELVLEQWPIAQRRQIGAGEVAYQDDFPWKFLMTPSALAWRSARLNSLARVRRLRLEGFAAKAMRFAMLTVLSVEHDGLIRNNDVESWRRRLTLRRAPS